MYNLHCKWGLTVQVTRILRTKRKEESIAQQSSALQRISFDALVVKRKKHGLIVSNLLSHPTVSDTQTVMFVFL